MPSNVEIKARVKDMKALREKAAELSNSTGTLIIQEDTFFLAPNGRLKLRELKGTPSQLIFYSRSDESGPKLSKYHITEINNPTDLKETLGKAMGIKGVVKKQRTLYMVEQTRVHVDSVDSLGDFMELEVVLGEGDTSEDGEKIAHDLMQQLGVGEGDLITGAYMDLILKQDNHAKRQKVENTTDGGGDS